ncbi:MAG TPA: hypothetical protein VNE16_07015 [Vicinamibacterales bacterium]|nr:hypothetical protein [Vicinamibacterales bacterium]
MQRSEQMTRVGFASGMIALGVIGLVLRDFALVWGPVPRWVPSSTALACVCAAVPLAAGIALLFRRTAAAAALVLFVYVGLWWWLLKVPEVVMAPLTELTWLDCGMFAILLAGAWTLFADLGGRPFLGGERGMRLARLLFGLSLIPTGLSHFVYASLTVPLIPSWLPYHLGWAYFTGACHLAAGLGVLFGVLPGLAASLEAAMLGIFTILVWIPRVIAAPATRGNWTELWISWALTAAAAVVAAHVPPRSRRAA